MTDTKKPGVAFWATVALSVCLVATSAYVGTYAVTVNPTRVWHSCGPKPPPSEVIAYYSPGIGRRTFWDSFFAPANFFDRKVRPATWESQRDPTSVTVTLDPLH
jgi:hypothetical protein